MGIFERLIAIIKQQEIIIKNITEKLEQLESIGSGGGGTGNASITDYESGVKYKRNALLVDTMTETVYRVLPVEYTSVSVEEDLSHSYLKLVGFENAIVTYDHNPSREEIAAIPDNTLVAVYSTTDKSYDPEN